MAQYWFKQRRFGFGATPSSWEGWLTIVLYIVLMLGAVFVLTDDQHPRPMAFIGVASVLTLALVYISWRKTEGGWRWRWGGGDDTGA